LGSQVSICQSSLHTKNGVDVACPPEGTVVRVLEADDGSGWVKVINESGESGLVPASYLEMGTGERGVPPTVGEKGTKRG